jgi:hypothetical protein
MMMVGGILFQECRKDSHFFVIPSVIAGLEPSVGCPVSLALVSVAEWMQTRDLYLPTATGNKFIAYELERGRRRSMRGDASASTAVPSLKLSPTPTPPPSPSSTCEPLYVLSRADTLSGRLCMAEDPPYQLKTPRRGNKEHSHGRAVCEACVGAHGASAVGRRSVLRFRPPTPVYTLLAFQSLGGQINVGIPSWWDVQGLHHRSSSRA